MQSVAVEILPGVAGALLARAPVRIEVLPTFDAAVLRTIAERVVARGVRLVVTNFREVSAEQV